MEKMHLKIRVLPQSGGNIQGGMTKIGRTNIVKSPALQARLILSGVELLLLAMIFYDTN